MILAGKSAIVTGGASGIGFGIAKTLIEHGANVVIADFNKEAADKAVEELSTLGLNNDLLAVQVDVLSSEKVKNLLDVAVDKFGKIDILINNVGGSRDLKPSHLTTLDVWEKIIEINLTSTFICTKAFSNYLIHNDVRWNIINISSLNYKFGTAGLSHYSAAKAGVSQYTEVVASELGQYGIRVNAIAPGSIETPLTSEAGLIKGKMREEFLNRTPLGRIGQPEDIGKAVVFLASELAGFVTGVTLSVDGGQHVRGLHSYYDVLKEMQAEDKN